jgi:hypothetical protein
MSDYGKKAFGNREDRAARHPGRVIGVDENPPLDMLYFIAEQIGVSDRDFEDYATRSQRQGGCTNLYFCTCATVHQKSSENPTNYGAKLWFTIHGA